MVDNLTKEQRKINMQAIHSQPQLEDLVSKPLCKERFDLEKMKK